MGDSRLHFLRCGSVVIAVSVAGNGNSVSPQTVGGYQGLRILDMQSGSYIEELGLRKDDLLLGANGKPLRGFGDLGGLGDLADKSAITLEVLRNGKKTIIRYDVQS